MIFVLLLTIAGILFPTQIASEEAILPPPEPVVEEVNHHPVYSSCGRTAREFSPYEVPRQDAIDFEPNSVPIVGGLVLLKYGEKPDEHHVAVIAEADEELCFNEGNFIPNEHSYRCIAWDDPHIRGFWVGTSTHLALQLN